MYVLKLIKGLSCKAGKVRATQDNPFCEVRDEATALAAVASGYFSVIKEPQKGSEPSFEKMTLSECKKFAEENKIDIKGLTKVADIREAISKPLVEAEEQPLGDKEFEFHMEDGSSAMEELQEEE